MAKASETTLLEIIALELYVARKDREAISAGEAPVLDAEAHNLDWATLGRKKVVAKIERLASDGELLPR